MSALKKAAFVPPEISDSLMINQICDLEFNELRKVLHEMTGIKLNDGKKTMIESRLVKRLKNLGLQSFSEYCQYLCQHQEELEKFINSMTTNKTEFYREAEHFRFLKTQALPQILNTKRQKRLRVWSAAASTGEEVYTLAIELNEFFNHHSDFDWKILGTDIDTQVLEQAQQGIYPAQIVKQIRADLVQRNFLKGTGKNQGLYRIGPTLKENIKFRKFNLISENLDVHLKFDIIFLRNVLIYFNNENVQKVINKMANALLPDGFLFIGHSETLNGILHPLEPVQSAVYQKRRA